MGSLMTRSPSTTSRAGSVTLEPVLSGSLSTVRTSSSATFSCLPPQRTIAYTRELSLSFALPSVPRNSGVTTAGSLERAHGRPHMRASPDGQGYQTSVPERTRAVRLPDLGLRPGRLRFPGCFRAYGLIGWTIVHKIHPQAPINPHLLLLPQCGCSCVACWASVASARRGHPGWRARSRPGTPRLLGPPGRLGHPGPLRWLPERPGFLRYRPCRRGAWWQRACADGGG